MTLVNKNDTDRQHDLEGLPRNIALTVAVPTFAMRVGDTVINVTSAAADDAGIVTLPSVAEAVGNIYYICAPTALAASDVSVYSKETGTEVFDLDANGDYIILFSDGTNWRTVLDGIAGAE